ncbi:hypothetical protein L3Y34_009276 [Caenorhabditis briggsae]|uniref:Uncharacterized protein n=1 Tax=Caenorhabditis briggsae TaxID=6238 RepID=A0AAE9ABN2_CAEBR|nr:hypothetical protein L3Y34_009276 [Caenorhabditis briggsae]
MKNEILQNREILDSRKSVRLGSDYKQGFTKNGVKEEQIYRVCNGKNKKTCGFWENIETKAKVESGKTTYNKNKKALVIKKILRTYFGLYMTGNKKTKQKVVILYFSRHNNNHY